MNLRPERPLLSTTELTCGLGGCAIVSSASVDVPTGAMVAVVGENGSGKSTFLRTVAGLIKPLRGEVFVDGVEIHRLSARARARRIAFVGQEDLPAEELQVWQAVALGLVPYQLPWDGGGRQERRTVLDALDRLGMKNFAYRRCDRLSGGERRRVILARGLVQRSELLILDEPTNHLDIRHQLELIAVLRGSGRTVLAAIHDLNLALTFFDHVVVLHGGGVLAQGPPNHVLTREVIGQAFEVDATVVRDHVTDLQQLALRPAGESPNAEKGILIMNRPVVRARSALLALPLLLAVGCAGGTPAGGSTEAASKEVTVTNCGKEVTFASPAQRLFVNDGNLIALSLAVGAKGQIAAVSSLQRDTDVLQRKYGDAVNDLKDVAPEYPTMETVLAARPDVMVAGWSYGYTESRNLTPDTLAEHDIDAYILSESCRQDDGARGTMDPWEAVRTDLTNLGAITGHPDTAADVVKDTEDRLAALREAAQPKEKPVVFVFDSGTDAIFSSGSFGGPQAIIEAGGGVNALADIEDTWTQVAWEKLAKASPDMIVFVDYPGQSFEEKKKVLASHPASRNLAAVKEERYLNLPYAMWTSGPLNIDAAEHLRQGLEKYALAPASGIKPQLDLGD